MPTILGANTLSDDYSVANSLRFNDGETQYLTRTASSGSYGTTYTISFWFKMTREDDSGEQYIYMGGDQDTANNLWIRLQGTARTLYLRSRTSSSNDCVLITTRAFRDPSAWYHIVYEIDTTQGTASNRVKLYVNGVQETSFGTETYPDQNDTFKIAASGKNMDIGRRTDGSSYNNFGLMLAEFCLIDGTALDADSFGEFDSASPNIWKPKDPSGLTFGTNGFYLDFEKSDLTTSFTDEGHNSLTMTTAGDTHHSFTQHKIGETSIKFDGTGDKLISGTHADFNLGTSNYTIEFWLYKSATMTNHSVGHTSEGDNEGHGFQIEYTSNKLGLYIYDLANDFTFYNYEDAEASNNQWYHYAWVRNGTAFTLYRDGTAQSATTTSSASITPTVNGWSFGNHRSESSRYFNGYLDRIRISDTARYTSNFTPSTTAFSSDSNTLLLVQSNQTDVIGADASGNGNHFEEYQIEATDQSIDTCTNNYAIINPIDDYYGGHTFSEGSLKVATPSGNSAPVHSTIGLTAGRWYAEVKLTSLGSNQTMVGFSGSQAKDTNHHLGRYLYHYGYYNGNGKIYNNNDSGTAYGNSYSEGNIVGMYLDLEDNKIYFSINGTLQNSGTGHSITAVSSTELGAYFFSAQHWDNLTAATYEFNFGSAPFSISSSNTDDNGYGSFEYSPNITGDGSAKSFYALNTKNLAEFG